MAISSAFFRGNQGTVTESTGSGFNALAAIIDIQLKKSVPAIDVGIGEDRYKIQEYGDDIVYAGTLVCRSRHADAAPSDETVVILTAKSKSAVPYRQISGSFLVTEIPFNRKRGNTVDDHAYAVTSTGSVTDSLVAA